MCFNDICAIGKPLRKFLLLLAVTLLVFAYLLSYEVEIYNYCMTHLIDFFKIRNTFHMGSIAFGLIALLNLAVLIRNIYRHTWYSFREVWFCVVVLAMYTYVRVKYESLFADFVLCIKYADVVCLYPLVVIIPTVITFFVDFLGRLKTNQDNKTVFKNSESAVSEEDDLLNMHVDAYNTAKDIASLTMDKCWRFGIVGGWGAGKTSYVNMVLNALKKKDENIIVSFNPRSSSTVGSIQKDCLDLLATQLHPYHHNIEREIRGYVKSLAELRTDTWASATMGFLINGKPLDYKEEIQKTITLSGKRIIVVIDDFDRLLKAEILEVLKLMSTNASFKGVVFLVPYDYEYVSSLFGGLVAKSSRYIEKYFDINKYVPCYDANKYFDIILGHLKKVYKGTEYEKCVGRLELYRMDVGRHLCTIRDTWAICNLFCSELSLSRNNVDFHLLFLLSVFQYLSPNLYNELRNEFLGTIHIGGYNYVKTQLVKDDTTGILNILFPSDLSQIILHQCNYPINREDCFANYFTRS